MYNRLMEEKFINLCETSDFVSVNGHLGIYCKKIRNDYVPRKRIYRNEKRVLRGISRPEQTDAYRGTLRLPA